VSAAGGSQIDNSPRSSIERAFDRVESGEDNGGDDRRQDRQQEQQRSNETGQAERNPDGTFKTKGQQNQQGAQEPAPKDQQKPGEDGQASSLATPPQRFSEDAKAAWKDAPEALRGEVVRMEKELTKGLSAYREAYAP